jgi:ketosteroid isomerase-like protein
MHAENLQIVRAGFDAYNRRDIEGTLETWAPDAVLDWSNSRGPERGVYRGHDEIRAFWQEFFAAFEEIAIELLDLQEVEGDQVIADNVAHMRGRDGIEVHARSVFLIQIRDGATSSFALHQTKEEALEAARLST